MEQNLIYKSNFSASVMLEQGEEEFQFSEKAPRTKKVCIDIGLFKWIFFFLLILCIQLKVKSLENLKFEDIHPVEFARQLALVDHGLYRAIQPSEVLHMRWTKEALKEKKSPNVLKMIEQFNRVGQWVISTIITEHDKPSRVKYLQLMIRIAYESHQLNNLNGAMAMISGLRNSNVIRLKDTWVSKIIPIILIFSN